MFRVECIESLGQLGRYEDAWKALLERYPDQDLFMSYKASTTWMGLSGERPHVLLINREEEPVGIAPLVVRSSRVGGTPWRTLGSIFPRGDFVIPFYREEAMEAIAGYWEDNASSWDEISLCAVPDRWGTLQGLGNAVSRRRTLRAFRTENSMPEGYLPVGASWTEYAAGRSRSFRRVAHRTLDRLERAGRVGFRSYTERRDLDCALREIFDIEARSWKAAGGEPLPPSKHAFFRELAGDPDGEFGYEVFLVDVDDRPVAGLFALLYGKRAYSFLTYYDEALASFYPGRVVMQQWIQNCFSNPAIEEISFVGDSDYIKSWSQSQRTYCNCSIRNSGYRSRIIGFLSDARNRLSGGKVAGDR